MARVTLESAARNIRYALEELWLRIDSVRDYSALRPEQRVELIEALVSIWVQLMRALDDIEARGR